MTNAVSFEYPVVHYDFDDPDKTIVLRHNASIEPMQFDHEPYEMALTTARGYYYHMIFGNQINGNFLCIPNWHVGCELAGLDNISWNMDSLLQCGIQQIVYEDISAIVYALDYVSDCVS